MEIPSLHKNSLAPIATALLLFSQPAFADDETMLGGFDEGAAETSTKKSEEHKEEKWNIDGFISLSSSYNHAQKKAQVGQTDYRGLSRLRAKLFLEFDHKFSEKWKFFTSGYGFYDFAYAANGRSRYTKNVTRSYEDETELFELYLQGTLFDNIDIKVGRQIVVWGKSDNLRITDILNPLDNREPGMTDIENLRLPVTMTKLDYYFGQWALSLIAMHEKRFDKVPAQGSDFNRSTIMPPPEQAPAGDEFAASLSGIFSGWDISFYIASLYNDTPRRQLTPAQKQIHDKLMMAGVATNIAFGNWLIKAEAARFDRLEFTNSPGSTKSRDDMLAGIEYQGLTDQSLSFEIANRRINGFEKSMKSWPDYAEEDDFQTAFRYTGNFINDTLQVILLASAFGQTGNGGGFQRLSGKYDWTDSVAVTAGFINYQSGSKATMRTIGNNDRLFLEGKYSF